MGWATGDLLKLSKQEMQRIADKLYEEAKKEATKRCPDCGAKPGAVHGVNCDVARCLICKGQLLSCDCQYGKPDIWDGVWPGTQGCHRELLISILVPDSHNPCMADRLSIKWQFDMNTFTSEQKNPSLREERCRARKERWGTE